MRSLVAESLAEVLQRMPSRKEAEPAVVLTGGFAYNVKINEWLRQKCLSMSDCETAMWTGSNNDV